MGKNTFVLVFVLYCINVLNISLIVVLIYVLVKFKTIASYYLHCFFCPSAQQPSDFVLPTQLGDPHFLTP